jgi:hypothetical protein
MLVTRMLLFWVPNLPFLTKIIASPQTFQLLGGGCGEILEVPKTCSN